MPGEGVVLLTRIVVAGVWILRFLPLDLLAPIGSALGSLLYILGRERRKVCLINLSRCLPEMTERERIALAKAHFRAFGRSVLERSILWWGSRERVIRLVKIVGLERVLALKGQPLILLAPHFVGLDAGCTRLTCQIDIAEYSLETQAGIVQRRLPLARTPLRDPARFFPPA